MLEDLDDFKYPKRKPWLLLVVVVAVLAALLIRRATRGRGGGERGAGGPAVEQPQAGKSPDAAVAAAGRDDLRTLAKQAQELETRGDLVGAREKYLLLHRQSRGTAFRDGAERRLGEIHARLVMTPLPMPGKQEYVVKPGDSIERIARRYGSTVSSIQKSNQIADPNRIRAGDRLMILVATFEIEVSKSRNDLVLLMNGDFFKRYRVGTGKFGKTPVGRFKITDKITEPVWWRPDGKEVPYGDPDNILGTRWLALRATGDTPDVRGYGIHGTWAEDSIGKAESAGCIRMRNKEVEELFDLVPVGTEVTIAE